MHVGSEITIFSTAWARIVPTFNTVKCAGSKHSVMQIVGVDFRCCRMGVLDPQIIQAGAHQMLARGLTRLPNTTVEEHQELPGYMMVRYGSTGLYSRLYLPEKLFPIICLHDLCGQRPDDLADQRNS